MRGGLLGRPGKRKKGSLGLGGEEQRSKEDSLLRLVLEGVRFEGSMRGGKLGFRIVKVRKRGDS